MDGPTGVAIVGLAVAWLLYRLERAATRRREIASARSVLLAVKRGMVGGHGDEPGWGDRYFTSTWTEEAASERAREDVNRVMERQYSQVLVVPTAPLEALIKNPFGGDLITDETLYWANIGLWHIAVFNQLVALQDALLAQHLAEVFDERTDPRDRYPIAEAIGSQSRMLHRRGVGEPDAEGGWYRRLREGVDADIERLADEGRRRLYPTGERRLVVGDLIATSAGVGAVITLVVQSLS